MKQKDPFNPHGHTSHQAATVQRRANKAPLVAAILLMAAAGMGAFLFLSPAVQQPSETTEAVQADPTPRPETTRNQQIAAAKQRAIEQTMIAEGMIPPPAPQPQADANRDATAHESDSNWRDN